MLNMKKIMSQMTTWNYTWKIHSEFIKKYIITIEIKE